MCATFVVLLERLFCRLFVDVDIDVVVAILYSSFSSRPWLSSSVVVADG